VRAAVEAGADSPKAVQAHHGCRFQCGKCRSSIGEMIAETDIDRGPTPALIAAE
jgi:bacterioferritin-associated ferredoxin